MTTSESEATGTSVPTTTTAIERGDVEWQRVGLFVLIAFGISWAVGAIVYVTGGISPESPEVLFGIPLWLVLVATGYMFAPALSNLLTRLVTGEGWDGLYLHPRFRRNWRWWVRAWFVPPVLVYLGAALFFALFPQFFDPTLSNVSDILGTGAQSTDKRPIGPQQLVLITAIAALTVNTAVNCIATFGEEFGWRGYLLPKLLPLGGRRAVVAVGVIWGVWHWPIILMGYNYPEAPILGSLAMVYFTVLAGIFLGWVALRGESVWPAVIGHAAINANAGIALFFVQGEPSRLLGPALTGVVASLPLALLALWLLARSDSLAPPESLRSQ
jgi:membrane protease YdiL (CAAX protease family)